MANNQYDFEEFEDDNDYSGTDLVKQLRKQIKELSRENSELQETLGEMQSVYKEAVVTSVLEEYGLNPKIAAFIPDEYADDEESIVTWLEEYGSLFGAGVIADSDEEDEEFEYDESVASAVSRMSEFEDDGLDPEVGRDLQARIESASNQDELLRILKGAN